MKSILLLCLVFFAISICIPHKLSAQLCAIPIFGQNLCNQEQTSYLANTPNSITINEIGIIPVAGTYTATISYYNDAKDICMPVINCPGATVTTAGSSVTIALGTCTTLPGNFSSEWIVYITLAGETGNDYFLVIYGGSCSLPLGYNASPGKITNVKKVAVRARVIKVR